MPPSLATRALTIGYPRRTGRPAVVAEALDLALHAGELVGLLGPNGAGKSTLMRTLAGMQAPLAGEVHMGGRPLAETPPRDRARLLGVVLTERVRAGMLTAYGLVSLGRHPYTTWTGRLRAEDHRAVRQALQTVGAAALADRYVSDLSDGERQKVMIARVLAQEASVLILDEITAFLDLPRRVEVVRLLRDLAHDLGRAVLLSTHDLDLALRTADRLWLMPGRGGVTAGAPEDLVLSGAFARAFGREGVHFDAEVGAFRMREPTGRAVAVRGAGAEAFWTRRALERLGYVVRPEATLVVTVAQGGGRWAIEGEHGAATAGSVHELAHILRSSEGPRLLMPDHQPTANGR